MDENWKRSVGTGVVIYGSVLPTSMVDLLNTNDLENDDETEEEDEETDGETNIVLDEFILSESDDDW